MLLNVVTVVRSSYHGIKLLDVIIIVRQMTER